MSNRLQKVKLLRQKFNSFMSEWEQVLREIVSRSIGPLQSVNFVLYFLVIVVGVGGIGPWLNFVKKTAPGEIFSSIATFSLTLAAASFADVILKNKFSVDSSMDDKGINFLTFPYTCLFILISSTSVIALLLCVFFPNNINTGVTFSKISLFLSLFFWWQVNSKNPQLAKNKIDPENAFGDSEQINVAEEAGFKI